MIGSSVHHVSFVVRELEPALKFYRDILGFEPIERPEMGIGGAWLQAGSTQVHLIVPPEANTPNVLVKYWGPINDLS